MIKDSILSSLKMYRTIFILFITFVILTCFFYFLYVAFTGDEMQKERDYAKSKIEYLENNISVVEGRLMVEVEEHDYDLIGNRRLLILANDKKDYEKKDLQNLLEIEGSKNGLIFGNSKVIKIDRFGFKEYSYDNVMNGHQSNIMSGYDLFKKVGLNSYSYEYIYGYMFSMIMIFAGSISISFLITLIMGLLIFMKKRKERRDYFEGNASK